MAKEKNAPQADQVEVRVLADCVIDGKQCKPNDIATIATAQLRASELSGLVDPHPDSVAHAKAMARSV